MLEIVKLKYVYHFIFIILNIKCPCTIDKDRYECVTTKTFIKIIAKIIEFPSKLYKLFIELFEKLINHNI